MKIYTKTGDKGTTALYGGRRVSKSIVRFEVIGCLDELNSYLGLVVAKIERLKALDENSKKEFDKVNLVNHIKAIQSDLLQAGADLATPYSARTSLQKTIDRIEKEQVLSLEAQIDEMSETLPKLKYFILPGGHEIAANMQVARSICRRAERNAVRLNKGAKVNPYLLQYVNRLSDWLFTMARYVNHITESEEQIWK